MKGITVDILASLRKNICEVTFTKKNGDERTMICTLIPDFLPEGEYSRSEVTHDPKPDQVTVWDIEENAWRSFKPSTVTDIKFDAE